MAHADLHRGSADDYASTARYHRALGLEPPRAHGPRPLADQFAEVEADLELLKARRAELRQAILDTGSAELVGYDWTVIVEEVTARRLDTAALERHFGKESVDAFRRVRTSAHIRIERL